MKSLTTHSVLIISLTFLWVTRIVIYLLLIFIKYLTLWVGVLILHLIFNTKPF